MTARPGRAERGATGPNADEGMVTAELAVTIPTVMAVLVLALTALFAVSAQLRCTDAAATAARLVARGESSQTARSAVRAIVGDRAAVRLSATPGSVVVRVSVPAEIPWLHTLVHLPDVSAEFREPAEPGVTS